MSRVSYSNLNDSTECDDDEESDGVGSNVENLEEEEEEGPLSFFYAFCLRVALLFFKNSISLPPLFVRLVIYIFPFLLRDVFFK